MLIHSDQSGGIGNGDRTNDIIVTASSGLVQNGNITNLVDGETDFDATDSVDMNNVTGNITFNFKVPQIVNRFNWTQNSSGSYGTWSFAGSNDNSSFTTLTVAGGSDTTFTLDDSNAPNGTHFSFTNTTAYQYYKLTCSVVGSTQRWVNNITFDDTNNSSDDRNVFTDSSSSTHTITPTGSYHSQGHGGIATAMTWPASLKKTGSAGVYFDGYGDYLRSTSMTPAGSGDYTYDFWFYPLPQVANQSYMMIFDTRDGTSNGITLDIHPTTNRLRLWDAVDNNTIIDYASDTAVTLYQWNHIALVRSSGTVTLYINGVPSSDNDTGNTGNLSSTKISIGQYNQHTTEQDYSLAGYIDSFRFSNSARYSSNFSTSLPTKIYGAYGPENPSIGTIEITAATDDSVDVAFSFQGSTQTNSAVLGSPTGLSLAEHGSDQKKALLTGTLNGTTGTVTNLRIQAKANNDDDRLVEVNETSGVGAISLTKAPGGRPTLFNARRWWGTGVARSITGLGLKPDLVWVKERDADASNHQLQDSLRGTGSVIYSNTNDDEDTVTDRLTSFDSDGFSLSTNSAINGNNDTFIGWAWKAGTSFSGTTNGSKAYSGSKNVDGGFSIIKYQGNATDGHEIPHGLTSAPDFVLVKNLETTNDWLVFHSSTGTSPNTTHRGIFNTTASFVADSGSYWSDNFPTSSVVTLGSATHVNGNNNNCIMYCWHSVANVSAFGSYTGATGGTRVYTTSDGTSSGSGGFRPRWIMTKASSNSSSYTSWTIIDAFRSDLLGSGISELDASTSTLATLYADQSKVENKRAGDTGASNTKVIIYDDGFKFTTGQDETNSTAGWTYIYMAFA